MGEQMVQTAFRLPQELLDRLDRKLLEINARDPLGRTITRSLFLRMIIQHNLEDDNE